VQQQVNANLRELKAKKGPIVAFHVRGGDLLADLTNNVSCPDTVHRTSLMCGCNTTPESLPGHGITLYYADLSSPQTDTKFLTFFLLLLPHASFISLHMQKAITPGLSISLCHAETRYGNTVQHDG